METPPFDPKAGEKAYYAKIGPDGRRHARHKPFSDADCGKYLANLGALLIMMEPPPRTVLDLGCGSGWTSIFLAKAGYEVCGLDISTDAIALAQETAAETPGLRVEFQAGDYEDVQPGRLFDYVLFYDALHHAEDEQAAVSAAYKALKPGGVLFAFEPGAGHSRNAGARHAVEQFGVHEKDMPPAYIWQLGRRAGFRKKLFLPAPSDLARCVYRRDYLKDSRTGRLLLEKSWGYLRALTKAARPSASGLIIMWK